MTQNFHKIKSWKKSGLLEACLAALSDWRQHDYEIHTVSSFGKMIWASVSIFPIMLNNKPHVVVQLTDQTEIQKANNALRSTSYRLELATRAASLGIWFWNLADDTITWG